MLRKFGNYSSLQCCGSWSRDPGTVLFEPRDPGWGKIWIQNKHPGSYFWELGNNFLCKKILQCFGSWYEIRCFLPLDTGSRMKKYGTVIRDKHPGSTFHNAGWLVELHCNIGRRYQFPKAFLLFSRRLVRLIFDLLCRLLISFVGAVHVPTKGCYLVPVRTCLRCTSD
jgi:hypothetical protein